MGFRGRIWAQFLSLFFEAIFLFCFGLVDNSQPWYVALAVLICFSLFVQMAEGTSYGIVPFMNRTDCMRGPFYSPEDIASLNLMRCWATSPNAMS